MRAVLTTMFALLLLGAPALAFWETKYRDWQPQNLSFKIGYLSGFMQGNLLNTYIGDDSKTREHFKTCLSFASLQVVASAMERTVKATPELGEGEVGVVLVKTLFSMCGPIK